MVTSQYRWPHKLNLDLANKYATEICCRWYFIARLGSPATVKEVKDEVGDMVHEIALGRAYIGATSTAPITRFLNSYLAE